jgi:signal recognition particle subunit SEC65
MSAIEFIKDFEKRSKQIREVIRQLNIDSARLNGVAAIIPMDADYPVDHWRGRKIILREVGYSLTDQCITAKVEVPYVNDEGVERAVTIRQYRFKITEEWFSEEE